MTTVHAVCTRTGNLAQYSDRKTANDNVVMLGEQQEYEPLSRAAYYKAMLSNKLKDMDVDAEEVNDKNIS